MKKVFKLFKNMEPVEILLVACAVIVGCENAFMGIIEETTDDRQRNQRLVMLNSAQAQDLNILILPEAYTKNEIDRFTSDACYLHSVLCKTSPYSYLMDKMNIWYAAGYPSETDSLGSKRTAFGSGFPIDRILPLEKDSIIEAVKLARLRIGNTVVVVLVNTDTYLGYCSYSNGEYPTFAVVPAKNSYFATTIIHELGHAIGLLADEYNESKAAHESMEKPLAKHHEEGYYLNVSASAEDIPWRMIMEDEAYEVEKTSVYVGAYYCSSGMFRSTYNSAMRSHVPYYNAISRLRIYQRIMKFHTGHEPTYEQFQAEDLSHPATPWNWREANRNGIPSNGL